MEFDSKRWKVYKWNNWMMIHWMINPGLAINELLLGQRVPKISLEDKLAKGTKMEISRVPCPHCGTIHDGRTWSTETGTAFKNWFGLYCPSCGGIIPCLMNGVSYLVLVLTFPIWGWFYKSLKANWLKKQPARYQNIDVSSIPNPYAGLGWIQEGIGWGVIMYFFMEILYPLVTKEQITSSRLLYGVAIWAIGGLIYGYIMKLMMNRQNKVPETV